MFSRFTLTIAAVALLVTLGCGPRAEVAKQNVLDTIDKILGKLDVEVAKIEKSVKDLESKKEEIRFAKNQAKANMDLIDKKIAPHVEKMEQVKAVMQKFSDAGDSPEVEIDGKKYTSEQIKTKLAALVELYKKSDTEKTRLATGRTDFEKAYELLNGQQTVVTDKLVGLQKSLENIANKKSALEMKKAASDIATNSSAIDEANTIGEDIDKILVDIEAQSNTLTEQITEKMKEVEGSIGASDAEKLLKDHADASTIMSEVDSILGK